MNDILYNNITKITETTGNFTWNNTLQIVNDTVNYAQGLEQTIQSNKTFSWVLYGMMGATITGVFIANKIRDKKIKLQERREQTKKELRELVTKIQEYEERVEEYKTNDPEEKQKRTLRISEIYIDNLPQDMQAELLDKTNAFRKAFNDEKEVKQPFLILIKEDATIELKKKAKAGMLKINSKDASGKAVTKAIMINSNKLLSWKIGKEKIKTYIAYENEAEAYPTKPKHFSDLFFQIVQKILLTEKGLEAKKGKFPAWILIVGIIAIIAGIGYFAFKGYFSKEAVETAANTAQTVIQNVTQNATQQTGTGTTTVVTIG